MVKALEKRLETENIRDNKLLTLTAISNFVASGTYTGDFLEMHNFDIPDLVKVGVHGVLPLLSFGYETIQSMNEGANYFAKNHLKNDFLRVAKYTGAGLLGGFLVAGSQYITSIYDINFPKIDG